MEKTFELSVARRTDTSLVISCDNLENIFRGLVHDAIRSQHAAPSDIAEYYLVSLLVSAVNSGNPTNPIQSKAAMAETYFEVLSREAQERENGLRQLGDRALFIAGFYSESLLGKTVSPKYFRRMGALAYARLADEVEPSPLFDLFRELAKNFDGFVEILGEVSESAASPTPQHVLSLYEKWLWTKSPSAGRKLLNQGVIPCSCEVGTLQ